VSETIQGATCAGVMLRLKKLLIGLLVIMQMSKNWVTFTFTATLPYGPMRVTRSLIAVNKPNYNTWL